ncbi:MAG: UDP-3-O-(3-hydroxymyristoyl)glucosamine N-acyltransferase [Planctomycetaceae bacterium]|nr:UDP-3-O-(3-hydroxymyristoyl)glucosamine N-acyltransferase [Planctomycetaceae bacterium]
MLISQLAQKLSAELIGDGSRDVTGVQTIQDAGPEQVCFLLSEKYAAGLPQSKAAAVLTAKPLERCTMAQCVVKDVQLALIQAQRLFAPRLTEYTGVHPTAVIDPSAFVDPTATVGPGACIAASARIGAQTRIGPNCFVGQESVVGQRCVLHPNAVIYHRCRIGNDCIMHANSTIGATGFGYYCINGRHELIPHNGGVILEDNVEIGANSCVDRAKFGNTVIGAGTKIDNQVQVAHNVRTGKHCLMAGQTGLAGSVRLGDYVVMGGRTGASDNVKIGDQAMIGVGSIVTADVESKAKIYGCPGQDLQNELRCIAIFQRLPELAKELRALRKKVEQLESAKNDSE